jgi:hypothetical protein
MTINLAKNPLAKAQGIFLFKTSLFLCLLLSSRKIHSQPRLEVVDAKKSFGFVKRGELVKIEFEIINKGNEPLLINNAEVSCSCTSVDFPKHPILPNQLVKVLVNFDTKSVYDRQDRIIYLQSNDPRGSRKIRYKGIVLRK